MPLQDQVKRNDLLKNANLDLEKLVFQNKHTNISI